MYMSANMYRNKMIICPYCQNENTFDAIHCFACGNVIPKLQIIKGQAIPNGNINYNKKQSDFPFGIIFFFAGVGIFFFVFTIIYVVF